MDFAQSNSFGLPCNLANLNNHTVDIALPNLNT